MTHLTYFKINDHVRIGNILIRKIKSVTRGMVHTILSVDGPQKRNFAAVQ